MNIGIVVKSVTRLVASASAGTVVSSVIRANTPANLNRLEKVLMVVGEFVVSGVLADLSADYVVKQIEEFSKKKDNEAESKEESSE